MEGEWDLDDDGDADGEGLADGVDDADDEYVPETQLEHTVDDATE